MNRLLTLCCALFFSCIVHCAYYWDGFTRLQYDIQQTDSFYIFLTISSDTWNLPEKPILLLKTFSDDIIKLSGKSIYTEQKNVGATFVGYFIIPITEQKKTFSFPITIEQIQLLKDGVQKIRLTLIDGIHEKTFKRDKIGFALWQQYVEIKDIESF